MALSDDQVTELLIKINSTVGEIKGTLEATVKAHEQRFDAVENKVDANDRRQWVVSACVIPIVTALHYAANKIGIKV